MDTNSQPPMNRIEKLLNEWRQASLQFNAYFNGLSLKKKRMSVILFGISTACLCLVLIAKSLLVPNSFSLPMDTINDQMMNAYTPLLTPLGKFSGDEVEVYVAIDEDGNLYSNDHPDFSEAYRKTKGWETITPEKLDHYKQSFQFIPFQVQVEK